MTERGCRGPRALLMEYALDDLDPLKRQRVESHVERCEDCTSVLQRYRAAFGAARTWEPQIEARELDQMVSRLTPYFEANRPRRIGLWVGGGVAITALAAAAAAFFLTGTDATAPSSAPVAIEASRQMVIPEPEPAMAVERTHPTEHLRVVASKDWNGRVKKKSETLTRVNMTDGFAVMSFEGGKGRQLLIDAPDVSIEVVGTRIYVEAHPGEPTVVGVVTGKVRVRSNGKEEVLEAGSARAFGEDGPRPATSVKSAAHHTDDFLEYETPEAPEPDAEVKPKVEPKRVVNSAPKRAVPRPPATDPMAEILAAEKLVQSHHFAEAAARYTAALDGVQGPMAELMRYERARLWAFKLDRSDAARTELQALAKSQGEVAVQAALTICELERADQPCRTRACLDQLAKDGIDEAKRTISHWRLDRFDCD